MIKKCMNCLERLTSTREYVETICVRDPPEKVLFHIRKKRVKTVCFMLIILVLAFVLCITHKEDDSPLVNGRFIERTDVEELISLHVTGRQEDNVWEKQIEISLDTREFTEEEKKVLDKKTKSYLQKKLKGKNASLEKVTESLVFPENIPDTDIQITWTVDDAYLKETGEILYGSIPAGGVDTDVMAEAVWRNWKKTYHFEFHIDTKKFTPEEEWRTQLKKTVNESIRAQADKEKVELPKRIGTATLEYSMEEKGKNFLPVYLVLAVILLLPLIWREQQKKEQKAREAQLLLDHPGIVNKFMLLLGAGMTVRKVVERLVYEYETERKDGGKKRYVYEELCVLLQEMKDGVSETKAIERFGKRCRLLPYLRFASVITQNMKKGAEGLLAILETEALESLEQRKARALQLGEKAGTKLLFPMMVMLGIVMGIIMVPAFMTM